MKIHHRLEAPATERPTVYAIGFFDGMHRGHREIVRALLRCRKPGYRAAVLTFRNHPSTYLRPDRVPAPLATLEERVNALAATGIDELFLVPFDEAIARLGPRDFCTSVVHATLRAHAVVIGENFRFGAGRAGDATSARETFGALGVETIAVAAVTDMDERISSTRIRAAVARGDMETADRLLGASYELRGRIELGAGRGHDLGFPTANLALPSDKTVPADGVYAATGRHDGRDYRGLVSIGTNPTFGGHTRTVEAWLRDFQATAYGEELVVRDLRFVREQRAFESVDALLAQMREDATHARFPAFIPA